MLYSLARHLLFRINPEHTHHMAIESLKKIQRFPFLTDWLSKVYTISDPRLEIQVFGLTFPNPVGLAAGFDKNANVYLALAAFGFGFIEVGTLTPRPQAGNPPPRLFRLLQDKAIINRMGFNNDGIEAAKQSFQHLPRPEIPIGINLGKNKDTPNEQASGDYRIGLMQLYDYGDYFVINVSSPNTQGLRDLQQTEALQQLLTSILSTRDQLADETRLYRPILLKIAPDLEKDQLDDMLKTALSLGIDGIIATNTTISRAGLHEDPHKHESGGLSGKPLKKRSTEWIRYIYRQTQGAIPIIGVGGIFSGQDAYEKLAAGASLVQVYTSMIYEGPSVVKKINKELLSILEQKEISSIREVIGSEAKS